MAEHRVSILGLGLIGASLGLALKQHDGMTVIGFDPDTETMRQATARHAIDHAAGGPREAIQGADTIVLAAPVRGILSLLDELGPTVPGGTLITDTGSTKAQIVARAEQTLPDGAAFVGGHPLAGRLRSRVEAADAGLFVGATYCLSPTASTPEWAVERASDLVRAIGATPHFLDPEEHDGLLAAVSHLPYFASAALVSALGSQSGWGEMSALAAGGFRTATSLVDGSPRMWADIALTNRTALDRQLGILIGTLTELQAAIKSGDEGLVAATLNRAYAIHREWADAHDPGAANVPAPASEPAGKHRFPFFR
jgi:prephenate dehydrogenase